MVAPFLKGIALLLNHRYLNIYVDQLGELRLEKFDTTKFDLGRLIIRIIQIYSLFKNKKTLTPSPNGASGDDDADQFGRG